MSSALVRQSTSSSNSMSVTTSPTPEEIEKKVQLYQVWQNLFEAHEPHGVYEFHEGCKICAFRAAWKVQHNSPSKPVALKFLANIPIHEINSAIVEVAPHMSATSQGTVTPFAEGQLMAMMSNPLVAASLPSKRL